MAFCHSRLADIPKGGLGQTMFRYSGYYPAAVLLALSTMLSAQAIVEAASNGTVNTVQKRPDAQSVTDSYLIGSDDVLVINVWKQPDISRTLPVRSDGKISLPLIGEVLAAGQTPLRLENTVKELLQPYLTQPEVTVIVQQINSQKFNILGRVARPGSYPLSNPTTVLDAIALAGGCREFAKQKSIYVLRVGPDGTKSRIPFNYQDVIKGKNLDQNVKLQPHDTIVVP
jgi:polysaccharide export outer membrane protein